MFEREDWTLLRSLSTIGQKAGVPLKKLGSLIAKELTDNGLDNGGTVTIEEMGDGIVVTSKLTRNDEEVTVAFSNGGGVKTLLASIANLELLG